MALKNLFGKKDVSSAYGSACGSGDKKASACGSGDKKGSTCGSACGSGDKKN